MTVQAFPNLTFEDPTFLTSAPRTNLLYVCGRQGTIWVFPNDPNTTTKTEFLSLTNRNQGYDDCGLLGMAFHPEFNQPGSTNRGYVYIYYQYNPNPVNPGLNRPDWTIPTYNRLSRFTVPDGSLVADPNSELVLINQFDQHLWHNGGGLFFGTDGFLYLSNGDEGGSDDYYQNAQKINKGLFSGVLRIDVNQDPAKSHPVHRQPLSGATPPLGWPGSYSSNYFIPNDNPFVNPDGTVLEEFFALGFRSPHRMTFDPPTGQIWLGDVGDSAREEVDLIVKGGNYQWDYGEGLNFSGPSQMPIPLIGIDTPPVYNYPHFDTNGNATGDSCVIGGYVYRGAEHAADLAGKYIFGDNYSGRIWSLVYNGTNAPTVTYLCNMPPGLLYTGLSSFGLDQNNELYMCQMGSDGQIWKLARNGDPVPAPPTLLSQLGIFTNLATLSTSPGLVPYTVNSPLWSDAALKSRWLALPNDGGANEQIGFAPTGEWTFPVGTVFVKHFELGVDDTNPALRKRLETRVLVHATNGNYYGLTYKWRSDNSEADLLTNSLNEDIVIATANGTRTQTWYYPSRQDCLICHNPNANFVLGVKTRQLNGLLTYPSSGVTDNQLRTLNHLGLFNPALDETNIPSYTAMVHVTNTTASLETRVRSYLDANCSQCHRPNGGVQANYDARFDTPLADQNIINGAVGNTLGITGAKVVVPSDISKSIMHVRLNTTGPDKMPPLARNTIDTNAVATLQAWINSLIPPSISVQPQSGAAMPGDSISFNVTAGGTGPLNYQWRHDGVNIPGATNSTYALANVQPANAGNYLVVVSSLSGGIVSSNAVLTINGPPWITSQPQSQDVNVGGNVTFSVTSSGTAPLAFQWQLNGTAIPGATINTYSLNNVQLSDAGTYSVVITNFLGAAVSSNAILGVFVPAPTIWFDQDVGDVFLPGSIVSTNGTFTINASGNDIWGDNDSFHFLYQALMGDGAIVARVVNMDNTDPWAKAGVMIRETLDPASAHAFMAITPGNGANFQRRVSAGADSDTTSGDSVSAPYWVKLVRSGDDFSGYISADGTNWVFVDDEIIPMTNVVYLGLAVCSHDNAVLNTSTFDTVQFIESITAQPQDKTVNQGADAQFAVLVDGTPLSYQWQFNGTNISGANASIYTVPHAQPADAGAYSVTVTNLAGAVTSSNASLTVNLAPIINTQPLSQTVILGGNVTFSVAASGMAPLTFQWQFNAGTIPGATAATFTKTNVQPADAGSYSVIVGSPAGSQTSSNAFLAVTVPPIITLPPRDLTVNPGSNALFNVTASGTAPLNYQWQFNSVPINGATGSSYLISHAQSADAGSYSVLVANNAGSVTSSPAVLVLNVPPSITTPPQSQSANQGSDATFTVAANGTTPLSFQWLFNNTIIPGATTGSYTRTHVQSADAGNYSVTIANIAGNVTSAAAMLTVNTPPAITTQPQNQSVTLGSNVTFSVIAGGTAPLNYQWMFGGTVIPGATSTSYTRAAVQFSDAGSYSVLVTNIAGSLASSPAALTVNVPPSIPAPPQSLSVNQGSDAFFSIVASGTAPLSFQWLFGTNVIPGATDGFYIRTNVQPADAGDYSIIITNAAGSVTSSAATLTVNIPPSITTQPQSQFANAGSNVTFSVVAGGTTPLSYQWMLNGTNISDATAGSYTRATVQVADAGSYLVVISNVAGSVTSSPAALVLNVPPAVTTPPQSQSVNQGSDAIFTVSASGTAPLSFQWLFGTNVIPGATTDSYTRTNVQSADSGDYSVMILNVAGSVVSSAATLTVNLPPAITTQPQSQSVTSGSNVTFTVSAGGSAPFAYQWLFGGSIIPGATSNSYTLAAVRASDAGTYSVAVTNTAGGIVSSPAVLTVNVPPLITVPPQSQSVNQGSDAAFTVAVSGTAPFSFQWLYDSNVISGATSGSYTRTNVQSADEGSYSVIVTNVAGIVISSMATLTVNVPPSISSQPQSQFLAAGSNVTFTVTAGGTAPFAYQWLFGGSIIPGATSSSYTRTTVQASDAGSYSVVITNVAGSIASSAAVLTINTAPVLAPVPDQVVDEGTTLSITNLAFDSDLPANVLVFSLDTNAPAGAAINATNGIFTWTPSEAQGPGTNLISVTVTDNGIPPLSDTKTFTVSVNEVNQSPVLAPIPDRVVHANTPVSLTASATDPDLPANVLTFSLDPGATAGAQINSTNGVFTWNPGDTQLGTNIFTIRVTDDGLPLLSDSKTFAVTVVARPTLQTLSVTGGNFTLSWSAIPGLTYRLQYKASLADDTWTDLPGDVTSLGGTATATDTTGLQSQRFYRIVLVP
jgi:uncharacterized repeat protein (TIGR03806 family)